jgi:hypothetical protein
LALGGSGGAAVPQVGGVAPVVLPLVELELELLPVPAIPVELELLLPVPAIPVVPVPAIPVELELLLLPVPAMPVELELLEELEELELDELELEELLEVEVLVLVELCPELPLPVEPPANIATAIPNSEGRLTPSTRPGTSRGSSSLDNTNSLLPL